MSQHQLASAGFWSAFLAGVTGQVGRSDDSGQESPTIDQMARSERAISPHFE